MATFKKSLISHNKGGSLHVNRFKIRIVKKAFSIILLLILSAFCVSEMQAQGRKVLYLHNYDHAPYHFGFLLGVNFMDYQLGLKDFFQNDTINGCPNIDSISESHVSSFQIINVESRKMTRNPGFSVGVIGDLRLGRYFNLRFTPTLSLSWRRVFYQVILYDNNNQLYNNETGTIKDGRTTVNSIDNLATYFEFPLHIKYRSKRYNNIAAYLLAGFNPRLYLISGLKSSDSKGNPTFLIPKHTDIAFEFGSGFDFYNEWFKMGIEIKMSFGMFNILKEDEISRNSFYQQPLTSLKNKQLQVSFTFE